MDLITVTGVESAPGTHQKEREKEEERERERERAMADES